MSTIEEVRRITEERAKYHKLRILHMLPGDQEKAEVCSQPYMHAVYSKINEAAQKGKFETNFDVEDVKKLSRKTFFGKPVFEGDCSIGLIMTGIQNSLRVGGYAAQRKSLLLGDVVLESHVEIKWEK